MVIEISRDIDKYQETVALGLTAKQLVFSVASVVVGGGLVLVLYRFIGLTASAYIAIPVVAPLALGGFYSYNGMSFYEMMRIKMYMLFGNKALPYISTENEEEIRKFRLEGSNQARVNDRKTKGKKSGTEIKGSKEDFEAMKQKTMKMLIGTVVTVIVVVIVVCAIKIIK